MLNKNKSIRLLAMLLVALVLLTSIAFAKDITSMLDNAKAEIGSIASILIFIFLIIGVVNLYIKRVSLWVIAATVLGGFTLMFLVSKPDLVMEVVNNTLNKVIS